jgi:hypothetical protein
VVTAYFNSSALIKRYVIETGTAWVRGITRKNPSAAIYNAHITAVGQTKGSEQLIKSSDRFSPWTFGTRK